MNFRMLYVRLQQRKGKYLSNIYKERIVTDRPFANCGTISTLKLVKNWICFAQEENKIGADRLHFTIKIPEFVEILRL